MAIHHNFNHYELELREGEYFASVMRKHWFVLVAHIIPFLLALIAPFLLLSIIPASSVTDATIAIIVFFGALWVLIGLMVVFTIWTNYYLDLWIVTNQRLIDIEQRTLFNREIKTLRMETVQDVQVDVEGIIQTFLSFGTLRVQTAGTGGTDAKIVGIPHPNSEKDIIMEQVQIINSRSDRAHSGMKYDSPHTT
jgi:membrane protein implicated in regulation of membrane protease activity